MVTVAGEAIRVRPAGFVEWESILEALEEEAVGRVAVARRSFRIVAGALVRSRPELTAAYIEEHILAGEVMPLIAAAGLILEASGLIKKDPAKGEALPAKSSREPV